MLNRKHLGVAVWALAVLTAAACRASSAPGAPDPLATAGATATPFDLSAVTLTPVSGEFDSFTVEAPSGWVAQSSRIPGGFVHEYVLENESGTRVAVLSVQCRVGVQVDEMMTADQKVVQGVGGRYVKATATALNYVGTTARQLDYSVSLAGVPVNYRSIYVYREPCGWRVTLAVFGPGLFDQYLPLFYRFASTFQPAEFEVPFDDRDPFASQPRPGE
jgi:hypothetical protein